jgi:hypothetical protein
VPFGEEIVDLAVVEFLEGQMGEACVRSRSGS